MYAIIKPTKLPVSTMLNISIVKLRSKKVSKRITPIARIRPGTAYPTVKKELKNFKKLLVL